MKLNYLWLLLMLVAGKPVLAQEESLLDMLGDDEPQQELVTSAFKSTRIIQTHSVENLAEGALDFRILHRFGNVTDGWTNFFGLDQVSARISFDYGITDRLMIGIGRTGRDREVDGFIKYRVIRQQTGAKKVPVSVSYAAGVLMTTLKEIIPGVPNDFNNRLSYYHQVAVARKFSDKLTLQLTPTFLHRNLVERRTDKNDLIDVGVGGRVKLTSRFAITADYHYALMDRQGTRTYNPFSIGVDIETGGHVFQLHFTNSNGLNERTYITSTSSDWGQGDFMFGFNLSRTFQVKKPKIRGLNP